MQDADKKGLSTIGEEVKQLAKKAKENSLKPQDYEVIGVSHYFYSSDNKDFLVWFINSWVELHYREVHLQCLTWEGHLVSNNSVQSSILLSRAFLQLDLVRTVLPFLPFVSYINCNHFSLNDYLHMLLIT